jgi:protein SCO1/2
MTAPASTDVAAAQGGRPVRFAWLLVVSLATAPLGAQPGPSQQVEPVSDVPVALRGIGIDQRLGERIPLDLAFRDQDGRPVTLTRYFRDRAVILSLAYYECPMLCTEVLNGLVRSLRALSFEPGREFTVLTVSFDPRDTPDVASRTRSRYLAEYGRDSARTGWHFLTGDEGSIRKLTDAAGFRYVYDAPTGQYVHATGLMVLTPDGRLARYFYGIDYAPRDLRLSLVEASGGRIGSPVDRLLLACYHYDPASGQYTLLVMRLVRIAGLATVALLGLFIVVSHRRDRRVV